MAKAKSYKKGSIKYIRGNMTLKRFTSWLKKAGDGEIGVAAEGDRCPIARFVVDALGAKEASIGDDPSEQAFQPSYTYARDGYEAGDLVGLPARKWAGAFVNTVDNIFDRESQGVTGKQGLRTLQLARYRLRNADDDGTLPEITGEQHDWVRDGGGKLPRYLAA